jgi:protein phosphatase PTC7
MMHSSLQFQHLEEQRETAAVMHQVSTPAATGRHRPRALAGAWSGNSRITAPRPTPLRFYAASSNIPHPGKNNNGEDACYISECGSSIGVSDGVGGWVEIGVDSGVYARELCTSAARTVANTGETCPQAIMQTAYDESSALGTATFCCLTIDGNRLRAANLGDSKFVLLRPLPGKKKLQFIQSSSDQSHFFNCPRQLGTDSLDMPSHADRYESIVEPGDIVVVGTDGLFDNLSVDEVAHLFEPLGFNLPTDEQTLMKIALHLATTAFLVSRSPSVDTPFAQNARRNNIDYSGGKQDDITVVVAVIHEQPTLEIRPETDNWFVLPRNAFSMEDDEDQVGEDSPIRYGGFASISSSSSFVSPSSESSELSPYTSYEESSPNSATGDLLYDDQL